MGEAGLLFLDEHVQKQKKKKFNTQLSRSYMLEQFIYAKLS